MIKFITIISIIISFFYPTSTSWLFIFFFLCFEVYLLLISIRKPGLYQTNVNDNNNFDKKEKEIYKKYYLYFRFPHTSRSFSTSLSLIALSAIIFSPWLLFNHLWLQAIIIGFNAILAGILSSKLNVQFYLHDAVERRGMEEFRGEMLLVDSICNKIITKQTKIISTNLSNLYQADNLDIRKVKANLFVLESESFGIAEALSKRDKEKEELLKFSTPSIKKIQRLNIPQAFSFGFVAAYPDVVVWWNNLGNEQDSILKQFDENDFLDVDQTYLNQKYLRAIIEIYKKTGTTLECSHVIFD